MSRSIHETLYGHFRAAVQSMGKQCMVCACSAAGLNNVLTAQNTKGVNPRQSCFDVSVPCFVQYSLTIVGKRSLIFPATGTVYGV